MFFFSLAICFFFLPKYAKFVFRTQFSRKKMSIEELIPTVITSRGCRFQLDTSLYPKDVNKNNLNVNQYRILSCDNIGWVPVCNIRCLFTVASGWTPVTPVVNTETKAHALQQLRQERVKKLNSYCAQQQQKMSQRKVVNYWPHQQQEQQSKEESQLQLALKLSLAEDNPAAGGDIEEKADEIYHYDSNNNNYTMHNSKKRPSNRIEDENNNSVNEEEEQVKKAIALSLIEEKRYEYDAKMKRMVENGTNWTKDVWQCDVYDFYDKRASQLAGMYGEAKRHWDSAQQEINFNNRNKQKQD